MSHVQCSFSIRLAGLGISWRRISRLWQEAEFLVAHGRRSSDDRGVIFCEIGIGDVVGLYWAYCCHLRAFEAGLLRAAARTCVEEVHFR